MKSWKVEAAIIAVGLLLLGIMVKGGINNFVNKDRVGWPKWKCLPTR